MTAAQAVVIGWKRSLSTRAAEGDRRLNAPFRHTARRWVDRIAGTYLRQYALWVAVILYPSTCTNSSQSAGGRQPYTRPGRLVNIYPFGPCHFCRRSTIHFWRASPLTR